MWIPQHKKLSKSRPWVKTWQDCRIVDSNARLLWFRITTPYDWLAKLAPRPMRSKTWTCSDLLHAHFPALNAVCLEFNLIGSFCSLRLPWLARVMTLVLVQPHSTENRFLFEHLVRFCLTPSYNKQFCFCAGGNQHRHPKYWTCGSSHERESQQVCTDGHWNIHQVSGSVSK